MHVMHVVLSVCERPTTTSVRSQADSKLRFPGQTFRHARVPTLEASTSKKNHAAQKRVIIREIERHIHFALLVR